MTIFVVLKINLEKISTIISN